MRHCESIADTTGPVRARTHWPAAALLALLLLQQPALADRPGGEGPRPSPQDEIEDLMVCYALGTDAIGRATDAMGNQPLNSTMNLGVPAFAEGLEIYRNCFTDDFSFTLTFGGVPALTVPSPSDPLPDADPALQWANFVNNAFRGPGYVATQHLMGSITSTVRGNRGTAQAYLSATHVYGPSSGLTGIYLVTGTYSDEVVRERGRWLISKKTLDITSSVDVPSGL
jgi:hypothetical protein